MPKATKKTAKKAVKKTAKSVVSEVPVMTTPVVSESMVKVPSKKMSNKVILAGLVVIVIAALTYKAGPWLFPAVVNDRPVSRFELWSRLEKNYGAQTMDDMVNEKVLDAAIAKSGVKVDQSKVDAQVKSLETQFATTGGLDAALKQRGLTRADLDKQIRTQLAIETLLADKITPTDAEVQKEFDDNAKTTYKDKKFEDVKASITDQLKQSKLQDAFLTWFADAKKGVSVKILDVSLTAPTASAATN